MWRYLVKWGLVCLELRLQPVGILGVKVHLRVSALGLYYSWVIIVVVGVGANITYFTLEISGKKSSFLTWLCSTENAIFTPCLYISSGQPGGQTAWSLRVAPAKVWRYFPAEVRLEGKGRGGGMSWKPIQFAMQHGWGR